MSRQEVQLEAIKDRLNWLILLMLAHVGVMLPQIAGPVGSAAARAAVFLTTGAP